MLLSTRFSVSKLCSSWPKRVRERGHLGGHLGVTQRAVALRVTG